MQHIRGHRIGIRITLASVSAVIALLTVAWPDWIELTLGVDPDAHSGGAEWAVVGMLALIALGAGVSARAERRRPRSPADAPAL